MKMTPSEKKCMDMTDVCELAHRRTVRECNKLRTAINCTDKKCEDYDEDCTHYAHRAKVNAQDIFNRHYDRICEVTGM